MRLSNFIQDEDRFFSNTVNILAVIKIHEAEIKKSNFKHCKHIGGKLNYLYQK